MHTSYDQVPYPFLSYAQSHPDRLATLAILLGLNPVPIERARVLELGCAGGGNLIPMALNLPDSRFVGIDNSNRQIGEGQAKAKALGLTNITLECLDILEIPPGLGQYDYIVAHGVYSWVPPAVQEKILQICRQNLAPDGIAYVSYNTYPGWHMMNILRDAMLYHTRQLSAPQARATKARAVVDFMAEFVPVENSGYRNFLRTYAGFLKKEQQGVRTRGNASLLHDELEEINNPVHFYQFAARAAKWGLQYLVEADLPTVLPDNLTPELSKALQEMAQDIIEMEQYRDFLQNRMIRQTLLCHEGVAIQRMIAPGRVRALYVASRARPVADDPDVHSISEERFHIPDGSAFATDHPVSKAAMLCLAEIWPQAISFEDLLSAARSRVGRDAKSEAQSASTSEDASVLSANLLRAYGYHTQLVELHVHAPSMTPEVSEHPVATPVARLQAQDGSIATNLWHERVHLNPLQRFLLPLLDGAHDRVALQNHVSNLVVEGILNLQRDGQPVNDAETVREILAPALEQNLQKLARCALLVG
jgi:methyltransferase-like protein/2-polyprenyl-3-methyl-5-hydroxy-6-metoxy-1,4-benzoquinol methylase